MDRHMGYPEDFEADAQESPQTDAAHGNDDAQSAYDVTNLICTLCACSGLFGLFLFFAERQRLTIRKCATQSAGLICVTAFLAAALMILATFFSLIPIIGRVIGALLWICMALVICYAAVLRVKFMFCAYRGEPHILPHIGKYCAHYE